MRSLVTPCVALCVALGAAMATAAAPASPEAGVYQYVVHKAKGTPAELAAGIAAAAPAAGFETLAVVPVGAPDGCRFAARVVALYHPEYAKAVLTLNRRTGPFGIVDRINVFEDENGVHVSVANPRSIMRTVLLDDRVHSTLIDAHLASLRSLVLGAVAGEESRQDYGQLREKAYIGRTMGVVAGGPFDEKVKDMAVVGGHNWTGMAEGLGNALKAKGPEWGLTLAYTLELPEFATAILGTTGSPMDTRSFTIVGAGADVSRSQLSCPGLAHAAAYPIEVVVTQEGQTVRTRIVETMYRMKMFFEDAGKWAFMKNMGMPGSIETEITARVRTAVDSYTP